MTAYSSRSTPKMLRATRSVLYKGIQYRAGDSLPANNKQMVDAWIEAGSAVLEDETAPAKEKADTKKQPTEKDEKAKK